MNYIISPKELYLFKLLDNIEILVAIILIILAIALGVVILCVCLNGEDELKGTLKKLAIITTILAVIAVFVPDSKTLIEMKLAKYGTTDNAKQVYQIIDKKTDDIIEALGKGR